MVERPILFSGPMVRAILEGRKSQTRRLIKHFDGKTYATAPERVRWQPPREPSKDDPASWRDKWYAYERNGGASAFPVYGLRCPYGVPGDRLWVRENGWQRIGASGTFDAYYYDEKSDAKEQEYLREHSRRFKRRPSIFMPRWACRLVLEVTAVRVERLQEIGEADAKAEGLFIGARSGRWTHDEKEDSGVLGPVAAYRQLWDSLNAKRAPWASNPWVWVVEFKLAKNKERS